jgi:DNA polymerase III subunit delta
LKLDRARIDAFLKAPGKEMRACLIYGPDRGLAAERAAALARAIAPDPNDAFSAIELSAESLLDDPARLYDETAQMSLLGGRRIVRVREAGDAAGALFAKFLSAPPSGDGFVIVEAGDLKPRSLLRRAFENAKQAASLPCYLDGPREIAELVRQVCAARKVTVEPEAMQYLAQSLGGDRALSRQEIEKLALYAGPGGAVSLDAATALVGDSADLSLDDAVMAAAEGDAGACERALGRALAEGEAPIRILRAALRHFERLHRTNARISSGMSAEEALATLRPPLFFKTKPRFLRQLRLWPPARAAAAIAALVEAERQTKSGLPGETLCRAALLRLARGAMALAPRKAS